MSRTTMIPLAVVGCDFRIAPSRARSQLVLNECETLELADNLKRGGWADGIAILDTCNRNEWIVASENPAWAAGLLQSRMQKRLPPELRGRIEPTIRVGDEAALHLFRVALGRESLMVGERQISGQIFKALARARVGGHSARILNGLESTTGHMVRDAQRQGYLESHSVGVHSLAISWLRQHLQPEHSRIAVVGMGSIGRRVAAILDNDPRFTTIAVNRTVHPGSTTQPLESLPEILGQVDAAILCTAAPSPLLDPSTVNIGQNLVLVDLGIPEQVANFPAPPGLCCVGLDQLVTWHQNLSTTTPEPECQSITPLVKRSLIELRRIHQNPLLAPVIEQVRCRSRLLMRTELKALLENKLGSISQSEREQIEDDLCALLGGYTDDVLHTIKEGGQDALREEP